jgi:hypothetical protein
MVEITGWGLPKIISVVTPTYIFKKDGFRIIYFVQRKESNWKEPTTNSHIRCFSAFYTTVERPCPLLASPPSAELLVLSASCGGMLDLSVSY